MVLIEFEYSNGHMSHIKVRGSSHMSSGTYSVIGSNYTVMLRNRNYLAHYYSMHLYLYYSSQETLLLHSVAAQAEDFQCRIS